jgi:hypothetical protein
VICENIGLLSKLSGQEMAPNLELRFHRTLGTLCIHSFPYLGKKLVKFFLATSPTPLILKAILWDIALVWPYQMRKYCIPLSVYSVDSWGLYSDLYENENLRDRKISFIGSCRLLASGAIEQDIDIFITNLVVSIFYRKSVDACLANFIRSLSTTNKQHVGLKRKKSPHDTEGNLDDNQMDNNAVGKEDNSSKSESIDVENLKPDDQYDVKGKHEYLHVFISTQLNRLMP